MEIQLCFVFTTLLMLSPFILLLLNKAWKKSKSPKQRDKMPPSPPIMLPIIGHLHHLVGCKLPHQTFWMMAQKYGPVLHLRFGQVLVVLISSPEAAKMLLKTQDPACANRPVNINSKILWYNNSDIFFSPYNEYWRQMRKICILELLSSKNIKSFGFIRQEEASHLIEYLHSSSGKSINLTEKDMFNAGTDTTSSIIVWTMAELMRNPHVMVKAQEEVRKACMGKNVVEESDIQGLKYLNFVIKETLRLHPPVTLLPRLCRDECTTNGFTIPLNSQVLFNIWSMGRNPEYWDEPESFKPERFENGSVDFLGKDFEFIPFGAGKRFCPGMNFGLANIKLLLTQLLYHFNWKMPPGMSCNDLDMTEEAELTVAIKNDIYLVPIIHNESC